MYHGLISNKQVFSLLLMNLNIQGICDVLLKVSV